MTKNNKLLILSFFLLWINNNVFSQQKIQSYVIVTFEDKYKNSPHGMRNYYWIIPVDSIKSLKITFSHLFLNNFSRDNLEDCCNGKDIDPFIVLKKSDYSYDSTYENILNRLNSVILKNRRKLQTIVKKWTKGQRENTSIFVTPISGIFCSSNYHMLGQERYGYVGKVFVPKASFAYDEEFWKSDKANFIISQDFTKIKFDIIPY